jgi:SAM-dependent methyltransferase
MNAFDQIYEKNDWGFGSGHGSLPFVTKGYREFLEKFLLANQIKSVLDYGCGDWQFSRFVKWGQAKYIGVDVVAAVVERNNRKFASINVSFRVAPPSYAEIPSADLIVVKDVLQHWETDSINKFVKDVLPRFKYALITNCVEPVCNLNREIQKGEFRPLDLRLEPFNVDAQEVYTFPVPRVFSWTKFKHFPASKKAVLLIKNSSKPN